MKSAVVIPSSVTNAVPSIDQYAEAHNEGEICVAEIPKWVLPRKCARFCDLDIQNYTRKHFHAHKQPDLVYLPNL